MIARIRKDLDNKEKGFTLIELLVVIIIIGILAAIAIPLFLNQRKKAVDTAARSDASTLGKEVAAYYVDNIGDAPKITVTGTAEAGDRRYVMNAGDDDEVDLGPASDHITIGSVTGSDNLEWCIDVEIAEGKGTLSSVKYSQDGLKDGETCETPEP